MREPKTREISALALSILAICTSKYSSGTVARLMKDCLAAALSPSNHQISTPAFWSCSTIGGADRTPVVARGRPCDAHAARVTGRAGGTQRDGPGAVPCRYCRMSRLSPNCRADANLALPPSQSYVLIVACLRRLHETVCRAIPELVPPLPHTASSEIVSVDLQCDLASIRSDDYARNYQLQLNSPAEQNGPVDGYLKPLPG
jgi:hypothetical protein